MEVRGAVVDADLEPARKRRIGNRRARLYAVRVEAGVAVSALLQEINAQTMKDMGRAMTALRERFAGKMDFGKASAKIKELLNK